MCFCVIIIMYEGLTTSRYNKYMMIFFPHNIPAFFRDVVYYVY